MEVTRADGSKEIIKYEFAHNDKGLLLDGTNGLEKVSSKYRSCIIDTISAPQNTLYKKINQDKLTTYDMWKDFGWEVYNLYDEIKNLPDTLIIQVLGKEGSGKTVGGKFLNPEDNVWINSDAKPLSFFGARSMYPDDNSRKNYIVATDYDTIKSKVKAIHAKRKGTFIVFILGHIEDYKGQYDLINQRLRVLGKQATKLGIEGLNVFATFYTKVNAGLDLTNPERYKLMAFNDGLNTARSPEGYFSTKEIPNNYQLISDRILEDYGELVPKV